MEKIELFPSCVISASYPEWVKPVNKIAKLVLKDTKNQNEKYNINQGYNLHSHPKVKPFADIIGKMSRQFLEEQGYNLERHVLVFEGFWPQEFKSGGQSYHEVHTHSNSVVSGFFFLKSSPNTSVPMFHDPRPGKLMSQLPEKNETLITPASQKINIEPKPGTLLMFNSYLPHSFSLNVTKDKFRFIHFTLIPILRRIVNI